jgi:S-adenosylmethionine hydrolase
MIVLFTDFGCHGPYVGQMRLVLETEASGVPVIELFNNAPCFDPHASAHLLAAYVNEFPANTIFLCVIDPGVGNEQRMPVVYQVDDYWFVGPGNGLFDVVAARGKNVKAWEINWRPERLSNSFHGRDLFAPVTAKLARGELPPGNLIDHTPTHRSTEDWPRVIYMDDFGNAMTGLRAEGVSPDSRISISTYTINYARTFSEVSPGQAFWYKNSNGLVEIAVNQGSAADVLKINLGDEITLFEY